MRKSFKWPKLMQKVLDQFPFKLDANGMCEKRTAMGCAVYATRPWICRTDEVRARCFPEIPADKFDRITRTTCVMIGGSPAHGA
jgi:hypothetical protein